MLRSTATPDLLDHTCLPKNKYLSVYGTARESDAPGQRIRTRRESPERTRIDGVALLGRCPGPRHRAFLRQGRIMPGDSGTRFATDPALPMGHPRQALVRARAIEADIP
ncbi:hypothetical protein GCM10010435_49110 [Winogradskya consettensis]|uniref:Uncharacterized protein n=1 Tax=Winogradskya consettensis TaxID=113560 RepID=A0A919VXX9_9ACTN|nr:hypothetical protein Aco04nite_34040 [Actinoplanes consettensis]